MKKTFVMITLTLFLFAIAGNVFSEEIAKEGTASGRNISCGTYKDYLLEEGTQLIAWEQKGVTVNDDPKSPFHNMSQNCAGIQFWNKGVGTTLGYCIGLVPDGDKIMFEVKQENMKPGPGLKKGTYRWIGGTGKFAGIEGDGEYSSYGVRPAEEGTYQTVGACGDRAVARATVRIGRRSECGANICPETHAADCGGHPLSSVQRHLRDPRSGTRVRRVAPRSQIVASRESPSG